MFYAPILDFQSNIWTPSARPRSGGVFGSGVAYELSPSFDIRSEYRGFLGKTPTSASPTSRPNRYRVNSEVAVGVAYHF